MASAGLYGKAYPVCEQADLNNAAVKVADLNAALENQWLPVGRVEELPEIGSYFTWERTGVPTLLVRSTDGEVRGFYNSCRHRGAPVVRTATGRSRAFRCQYHSWTYDSFGRLLSIPDERDFGDINRCAHGLVPLPLVERGGWLWINPRGSGVDAEGVLAGYDPLAARQKLLSFQGRATHIVDGSWAQVQPLVHAQSSAPNLPANLAFHHKVGADYLVAIWPRDDLRLELEVVACSSANTAQNPVMAKQYLEQLIAKLAG